MDSCLWADLDDRKNGLKERQLSLVGQSDLTMGLGDGRNGPKGTLSTNV